MSGENPYCVIITGDFNCRSTNWWGDDIKNDEGKLFEPFTSDLGLHQLINELTHSIGNSRSCIDVIFTDQIYSLSLVSTSLYMKTVIIRLSMVK